MPAIMQELPSFINDFTHLVYRALLSILPGDPPPVIWTSTSPAVLFPPVFVRFIAITGSFSNVKAGSNVTLLLQLPAQSAITIHALNRSSYETFIKSCPGLRQDYVTGAMLPSECLDRNTSAWNALTSSLLTNTQRVPIHGSVNLTTIRREEGLYYVAANANATDTRELVLRDVQLSSNGSALPLLSFLTDMYIAPPGIDIEAVDQSAQGQMVNLTFVAEFNSSQPLLLCPAPYFFWMYYIRPGPSRTPSTSTLFIPTVHQDLKPIIQSGSAAVPTMSFLDYCVGYSSGESFTYFFTADDVWAQIGPGITLALFNNGSTPVNISSSNAAFYTRQRTRTLPGTAESSRASAVLTIVVAVCVSFVVLVLGTLALRHWHLKGTWSFRIFPERRSAPIGDPRSSVRATTKSDSSVHNPVATLTMNEL